MYRAFLPFVSFLLLCLQIGSTIAHCGTGSPSPELIAAHQELLDVERTGNFSHLGARDIFLTVNMYIHIVETAAAKGTVTDAMIQSQLAVLQSVYNTYQISFNLLQTTRTVNDSWALQQEIGSYQLDMKTALRQGDYKTLNIYILPTLKANDGTVLLGDCTLPIGAEGAATATDNADSLDSSPSLPEDGCRLVSYSFPAPLAADDSNFGANGGFTLVHEVGHWFGLLHTFEGDTCGGPGDYVDDTRKESIRTSGCPKTKNSCPDPTIPGEDPFHNYMDYATDDCLTNFTPGQITRALGIFQRFRAFITPVFPTPVLGSTISPTDASPSSILTSAASPTPLLTTASVGSSLTSSAASPSLAASSVPSSVPSTTGTGSSISTPPSTPFALNVQIAANSTNSPSKRQALAFLTAKGFETNDQTAASLYYILNGQLFAYPSGGQISTSPGVVSAAFDSTAAVGSIKTSFASSPVLSWTSNLFSNNPAIFCSLPTGQVMSIFTGLAPTNCVVVTLRPFFPATSSASITNIVNPTPASVIVLPGTSFTIAGALLGQAIAYGTAVYYNAACGCLLTTTYTSALPTPTVYTITSTYYNQQCGCMSTTTYTTTSTVGPVPVTVTVAATAVPTTFGNSTITSTLPTYTARTGDANKYQTIDVLILIPSLLTIIYTIVN